MNLNLINNLKSRAGYLAYNSFFYDWSLKESTPDRLIVRPVDAWPGNSEKAQELLNAAGVGERTGALWYEEWWSPEQADEIWRSHMHGFGWLRDLRALDGALAREQGRVMIESWINHCGSWQADSWRSDLIGNRLAMWICHYEFFCANASEEFEEKILSSIVKQAKHLSNYLAISRNKAKDIEMLEAIKGLLYSAVALAGHEKWLKQSLSELEQVLDAQILPDGGHISRSPATLLSALEIMVDMKIALKAGAYTVPEFFETTISNMSSALRLFRYNDRKFGMFNGSQEGNPAIIDSILAQAGTHKKAKHSLKDTGYERMELGRSLLVMDTGKPPSAAYDRNAHAAPLAFEFCHGKERLFVSCGSHPISEAWRDALRFTAAHNTACLDYRNAYEIKKDGHFGRKSTKTDVQREEVKGASLVVASHNGYEALNGVTHTRKIYMADEGNDLRGQDDFSAELDPDIPVEIALRFHLHPNVSASLINDGEEILLRMPGGVGWRFRRSIGTLELEDSLYLGSGITPRKTKQIAIYGHMTEKDSCIKWSLRRE